MKKTVLNKVVTIMAVALLFSCKSGETTNNISSTEPPVEQQEKAASLSSEPEQLDTLSYNKAISSRLSKLKDDMFWKEDLFSKEYYEVCSKLLSFSDGDALWVLGSSQKLCGVSASEIDIKDSTHATVVAWLDCVEFDTGFKGMEERRLNMILVDNKWVIDDVNNSKEEYKLAVQQYETANR